MMPCEMLQFLMMLWVLNVLPKTPNNVCLLLHDLLAIVIDLHGAHKDKSLVNAYLR